MLNQMLPKLEVHKKDGTVELYNELKLKRSISNLLVSCKNQPVIQLAHGLFSEVKEGIDKVVETRPENSQYISTKEIQLIVEGVLSKYPSTSEAWEVYQEYSALREIARERSIDIKENLGKLRNKDSSVVNENANKDSKTFFTGRDLTAGTVAKSEGLKMLPKHVANAHMKGEIHFHDLDYNPYEPYTNCTLIDFKGMLENGFKIGNAEVESPKSIQTAMAQVSQIIANVASSQYGLI